MDCRSIDQPVMAESPSLFRRAVFALEKLASGLNSTSELDLETAPDRVKRDLGFLDGRDPRYEDDRLR